MLEFPVSANGKRMKIVLHPPEELSRSKNNGSSKSRVRDKTVTIPLVPPRCKISVLHWRGPALGSHQAVCSSVVRFGEFELDRGAYELRKAGRSLRLARIPMELLLLLLEQPGQLVSRERIAERIWGKDVFLDIDNGINAVVREDPTGP